MKSNTAVVYTFLLCSLIPLQSLACSCMYSGDFPDWSAKMTYIVRARVVELNEKLEFPLDGYFEMEVDISSTIKGSFPSSRITFYGSRGMNCNRYIKESEYPIGSEHFFALYSQASRHPLTACAESSVSIEGDVVNRIQSGQNGPPIEYQMDLDEFMELLSE